MSIRNLPKILLALSLVTLTGCASIVATAIPDSQRNTDNTFDGVWRGVVSGSAGIQYVGGQGLNCYKIDKRRFVLRVNDGRMSVGRGQGLNAKELTNVDDQGNFRLEIPAKGRWTNRSNVLNKGGMVYVFQGSLPKSKGQYTVGMEALNANGCSYSMKIENVRLNNKS